MHVIAKAEPQNKEARAELKAVQELTRVHFFISV
jgi:hypothetical protein